MLNDLISKFRLLIVRMRVLKCSFIPTDLLMHTHVVIRQSLQTSLDLTFNPLCCFSLFLLN